jgi:ATP-dependent Lhr-like helicase
VIEAIDESDSAIVFTNTRSQTEIWYQAILAARPDWAGIIALHHGSLDRARREWVEDGLRAGRLRCVVATSSLDLGVDFSPVDRVLQIGSPKGVARLPPTRGSERAPAWSDQSRDMRADERARADRGCSGARRGRARVRSSRAGLSIAHWTCWRSMS